MNEKIEHRVRDLRILVAGSVAVTFGGILGLIVLAYSGLEEPSLAPLVVAMTSVISGFIGSLISIARLVEIGEKLTPLDEKDNRNTQSGSENKPE